MTSFHKPSHWVGALHYFHQSPVKQEKSCLDDPNVKELMEDCGIGLAFLCPIGKFLGIDESVFEIESGNSPEKKQSKLAQARLNDRLEKEDSYDEEEEDEEEGTLDEESLDEIEGESLELWFRRLWMDGDQEYFFMLWMSSVLVNENREEGIEQIHMCPLIVGEERCCASNVCLYYNYIFYYQR